MDFADKARKLKEVLDLPSEPVGVRYTDEAPEKREEGYYTVCGGIPAASNGKTILLSEQDCACFGGIRHLGLTKREEGGVPGELLVEGEKLWADLASYHRSSKTTGEIAEPPYNLGENVVLYPLSEELYNPDLVLVIGNAEQACRLVTLNQFWDGKSPSMEMRGSLCWSSVTYPLVSGNMNVTPGDTSARRMENWNPAHLIISIPKPKLDPILKAMDKSTAGTAEPSKQFEEMTEKMVSRKYSASEVREV